LGFVTVAVIRPWLPNVEERTDEIDGQRKDDRRVVAAADLREGLEVAKLQRGRAATDDLRGIAYPLGGLKLAFGVDDLGAALPFRLCLARHRTLSCGESRRP
jgi:hypothetical protein